MTYPDPTIPPLSRGDEMVRAVNQAFRGVRRLWQGPEAPGAGPTGSDPPLPNQLWVDTSEATEERLRMWDAAEEQWVTLWRMPGGGHPAPVNVCELLVVDSSLTMDVANEDHRDAQVVVMTADAANRTLVLPSPVLRAGSRVLVVRPFGDNAARSLTVTGTETSPLLGLNGGDYGAVSLEPGDVAEFYAITNPFGGTGWTLTHRTRGGVVHASSAYTVGACDRTVIADAAGGAFTVTLPAASSSKGMRVSVHRANSGANAVTIATAGGNINESATATLSAQYEKRELVSDGVQWWA